MENFMRKFLAVCFSIIITISLNAAVSAKSKTIKVCALPYAPFVIVDQHNKIKSGFDVDLAKAMCKEAGAKCKFIYKPSRTTFLEDLNSGQCDTWIAGFTITPYRKKNMEFTDSYYPSTGHYAASKNTTFTSSVADFKGKKIAVVAGANFIPYLESTYGNDITLVKFPNDDTALVDLKANKVDAVISDSPVLMYWKQQKGNENFRLIELLPVHQEFSLGEGYGMPVKKDNKVLLASLNQALKKIKTNGTYENIVKKYFSDK
jgi:arginine transport system substrate-binding protein